MSYLVIARKWRPNLFEEIVGQAHVTRTLRNAVSSGRIAHAYLFSGPRGVGKTTAARILAKSLNCVNGPTATPCNACDSCKGIANGSSVDVFEIDGASNTSVDNVRELRESVRYVPTQGKYKVYIIDEVHMLSGSAFNALLKTLEEPPPHAVFIFATTEVHKIPATILSRCQRFDFKRIPFRDIQQHLKKIVTEEGIRFEEQALYTLAREADGSLRDSQSLLEQVLAFSAGGELKDSDVSEALGLMDRSILYEISEAMISKDPKACLNIVEKIYEFGYDLKRGCSDLLEHLRDLTVIKVTGDPSLLDLPDSETERLKAIASGTGAERLHMLFNIVSRAYEEISRSPSPRYSFEMALLKGAALDDLKPVSELISRLESLKGGVRPGPSVKAFAPSPKPQARDERPARQAVNISEPASAPKAAPPVSEENLTAYLKQKIRSLAETLSSVSVRADGDELEIIAPADKAPAISIKKDQIEAVAGEFLKRKVRLKITQTAADDSQKKRDSEPLIKAAVHALGGRIIDDRRRTNV